MLRARYVFPVAGPPIEDGVVVIHGAKIVAVERAAGQTDVTDLGNVAIVPGFVNAHTHLELSDCETPLGHAGIGMADWIRLVLARRCDEPGKQMAIATGLDECCRQGVTAVGDITSFYWPAVLPCTDRLRPLPFFEFIAPTAERGGFAVQELHRFCKAGGAESGAAGISPHSPYTVSLTGWPLIMQVAIACKMPVAVHLAESREEVDLLHSGRGPLRELLDERRGWTAGLMALFCRPIEYLRKIESAPRALVVHGNYLDDEEIAFLAARAETMSVVYCPRTHAYFGHDRYPLVAMLAAGANVAVGTDSRASSPDLCMLSELRLVARTFPEVPPRQVLELGTLNGARALGCADQFGTLEAGKAADLAIVALPDVSAADPHALLFDERSAVVGRYFNGQ